MPVEINTFDGVTTLVVSGELDVASCGELRECGEQAAQRNAISQLRIDLAGVSFIDSTGIGALVAIRNAADSAGVPVVFSQPSAKVLGVLELTRLTDVFTIESDDGVN
jgi:anti-sigma B factor antagonist